MGFQVPTFNEKRIPGSLIFIIYQEYIVEAEFARKQIIKEIKFAKFYKYFRKIDFMCGK